MAEPAAFVSMVVTDDVDLDYEDDAELSNPVVKAMSEDLASAEAVEDTVAESVIEQNSERNASSEAEPMDEEEAINKEAVESDMLDEVLLSSAPDADQPCEDAQSLINDSHEKGHDQLFMSAATETDLDSTRTRPLEHTHQDTTEPVPIVKSELTEPDLVEQPIEGEPLAADDAEHRQRMNRAIDQAIAQTVVLPVKAEAQVDIESEEYSSEEEGEESDEETGSSDNEQSSSENESGEADDANETERRSHRHKGHERKKRERRPKLIADSRTVKWFFNDARFFLIKSANAENVSLSKAKGVWATTRFNERMLNERVHDTRHVILVFSVERSGSFQGFARLSSGSRMDNSPVNWVLPPNMDTSKLGGLFRLQWLCRKSLPFDRTMHLSNPLNENKPVKVGRDGQEIQHTVGKALCEMFHVDDGVDYHRLRSKAEVQISGLVFGRVRAPPVSMGRGRARPQFTQHHNMNMRGTGSARTRVGGARSRPLHQPVSLMRPQPIYTGAPVPLLSSHAVPPSYYQGYALASQAPYERSSAMYSMPVAAVGRRAHQPPATSASAWQRPPPRLSSSSRRRSHSPDSYSSSRSHKRYRQSGSGRAHDSPPSAYRTHKHSRSHRTTDRQHRQERSGARHRR